MLPLDFCDAAAFKTAALLLIFLTTLRALFKRGPQLGVMPESQKVEFTLCNSQALTNKL